MSTEKKYSLWLIPAQEAADDLRLLIEDLAILYGLPGFKPHITLATRIEGQLKDLEKQLHTLARGILPMNIELKDTAREQQYFRSYYLKAVLNNPLKLAREQAKELFHTNSPDPFLPHLSLAYGLKSNLAIPSRFSPDAEKSVIADSLMLVDTSGPVTQWKTLVEAVK